MIENYNLEFDVDYVIFNFYLFLSLFQIFFIFFIYLYWIFMDDLNLIDNLN